MIPQELRIGNLLNHSELGIVEVIGVGKDYIHVIYNGVTHYENIRSFSTIPLTEEILLKFGFYEIYKSEFSIRYGIENFDEIEFKWNKTFGWNFYYKTFCIEGIKLVHQLQNLFFSLCSEELTVK